MLKWVLTLFFVLILLFPSKNILASSFEFKEPLLNEIRSEHLVKVCEISEPLSVRIVEAVDKEAKLYSLDIDLILGLIIVESRCNPGAVSSKEALGLMQVMPATGRFISRTAGFKWSGTGGLRAIESNIAYGTWYYKHLLEEFPGDEHAAIAAYNWGPGHIQTRINNSERLPKVYPGKVYAAAALLRGDIWNVLYNKCY